MPHDPAVALDPPLLRKLEQFRLHPRGRYCGGQIGLRRSVSRGTGLEFADHRDYAPGDDIRYVDWNLYGRLEELFVKVFDQDEALPVHILLDASGSMSVGQPAKGPFAARLAAALAYVGLASQDHVRVTLFDNGVRAATRRALSSRVQIHDVLDFLRVPFAGTTDLARAVEAFLQANPRAGRAFILSDFLDPRGVHEAVRLLSGRRYGVDALHIVAPGEMPDDLSGDLEMEDAETGRLLRVALRRDTLARYRHFVAAWHDELRSTLHRYGAHYLSLASDRPLDEVLFTVLPRQGVLV